MINAAEIKGIKGLYAFKALHTLLFNYYLLPVHDTKESYTQFLKRFNAMPADEKKEVLTQSLYLSGIDEKEIFELVCFATDGNGIHYSRANIGNLEIKVIFEIVVDVCLAICELDVFF